MIGPLAVPSVALGFAGFLLLTLGFLVSGSLVSGIIGVVALVAAAAIQIALARHR